MHTSDNQKNTHPIARAASGLMLAFTLFAMLTTPVMAYASAYGIGPCQVTTPMGWRTASVSILNRWSAISRHANTRKGAYDIRALDAGIAYVNNNVGAAILKIPGNQLAGKTDHESMVAAPVVMAFYDPQSSVGRIWVDRAIRTTHNNILVEQLPFAPQDGVIMSAGYNANNPFWQFVQGVNGNPTTKDPAAWVKVGVNGFFAAVGMVMRQFNAQRGLIASMNLTSKVTTHSSGNFFRTTTTQTVTYKASPQWTLVLPSGEAPGGYTVGYKLPICNSGTGAPLTSATPAGAQAKAMLWSSSQTEAGISSINYKGQYWGALTIPAGTQYINQGTNPIGLDTSAWQVYRFSQSQSGWSVASLAIFSLALGALTGGLLSSVFATGTLGSGAAIATQEVFQSVGLTSADFAAGAAFGAGVTAATTLLYDTNTLFIGGSHRQSGSVPYSFSGGSLSVFNGSGNSKNKQLSVSSYNLDKYLAALFSSKVTGGAAADSQSSTPMSPYSGSNGVVAALTNVVTSAQLSAPGSLGTQSRTAATNAGATASSAPSSITRHYTNDAATSIYGSLPPAP